MRALIIEDIKKLAVAELPRPETDGSKAIIKVAYAGICGSDVGFWSRGMFKGTAPGHEFSGTIVDPGNSTALKAGDRVTAMEITPCLECRTCREGYVNVCPSAMADSPGIGRNGGMAEYVAVRTDMVRKLPEEVSDIEGALVEPTAVSMHAVRLTGVSQGSRVLVTGSGPSGLLAAASAKALGADYVAITEVKEDRMEFPRRAPYIDEVFNALDPDLDNKLLAATGNEGFNQAIEGTGNTQATHTCLKALKKGGKLAIVGVKDRDVVIPMTTVQAKAITLVGDLFFLPEDFDLVLALMKSKKLDVANCATCIVGFGEGQKYFEQLYAGAGIDIKILLNPEL